MARDAGGSKLTRLPSFAIVTPSFEQGDFLGYAIESVLAQDVEEFDYLVVDGASKDSSLEVLKGFGDRIRWVSEPDRGQSHAINKGFRRTEGEILAWVNADDELAPGALARVGELFARHPEVDLVYGCGKILDEAGRERGPFAGIEPFCLWRLTHFLDFVLQPAAFFRRRAFEEVGGLDESLHYTMDWDLWIRLAGRGRVLFVDEVLGHSREYGSTKTSTGGWPRIGEISRLTRRHTGRRWTPGVKMYLLDTLQRGLAARLPAPLRSLADGLIGRAMERVALRVGVYADSWHGPRSAISIPACWTGFAAEVEVPELGGRHGMNIEIELPGGHGTIVESAEAGSRRWLRAEMPGLGPGRLATIHFATDASIRPPADRRELAFRLLRLEPWNGKSNGDLETLE